MALAPHSKLSSYEILAPIGAGAMGEVYRAKDTRLGREVAIKVLPEHFAADEERLKRFEREAKTLATVNHPNVAQIFGVDRVDGTSFLVLELVPGESLADRLKRGPLPLEEAIAVCKQIAEGLEAAHELGLIHRDLKPANAILTPEGKVKLVDFGLAKSVPQGGSAEDSTDSVLPTEEGRLLGTPTYMAPEQARGKPIDKRVDIWAFGCVLYECLTKKRAFAGATMAEVLGAVMHTEPDWKALPSDAPAHIRELIARCLAKEPHQRLRDIGEARIALEQPFAHAGARKAGGSAAARGLPWAACTLLALALVFVLLRKGGTVPAAAAAVPVRTSLRLPAGARLDLETNVAETTLLAISPDAAHAAFVANDGGMHRLFLRALDSFDALAVPGSEDATSPFFSPDSRWVAFFARGRLYKVAVAGGAPIDLCEAQVPRGGCWGPDGTIVFPPGITTGLARIPGAGGRPGVLTTLDLARKERSHRWPAFLPGGKEVAYTVGLDGQPDLYDDCEIDAVSLATGKTRHLGIRATCVRATEDGELLLARHGRVSSVPYSELGSAHAPEPVVVLQGVAGVPASGAAHFDVARNGTLLYAAADPHAGEGELAWVSRDGKVERLGLPTRRYVLPRVSPDGTRIAFTLESPLRTEQDVWIQDLRLGSLSNLSLDGRSIGAVWSPDGTHVTYQRGGHSIVSIVRRAVDGSGQAEVLRESSEGRNELPLSWTPDEQVLICVTDSGPPTSGDLLAFSLADKKTWPILATEALEYEGALSPDGHWLATASIDSAGDSVWVQAFPAAGGRWQVSASGALPCWSRDGKELFYVDGQSMMSVHVTTQPSFSVGAPARLFTLEFQTAYITARNMDVAPDGRFLVVLRTSKETLADHLEVVQNWLGESR